MPACCSAQQMTLGQGGMQRAASSCRRVDTTQPNTKTGFSLSAHELRTSGGQRRTVRYCRVHQRSVV